MHFSPAKNFETADYQQFLKRTNAQRHIVLNESNTYSGLVGVHRQQAQFNQLNYEIFPLLQYVCNPKRFPCFAEFFFHFLLLSSSKVDPNPTTYDVKDDGNGTVHNVCTSTIFNLRKRGKSDDEINNDFAEDDVETSIFVDGGEETADRANLYPKIVFLGTSSQRSGPFRNVSSILVHTSYVFRTHFPSPPHATHKYYRIYVISAKTVLFCWTVAKTPLDKSFDFTDQKRQRFLQKSKQYSFHICTETITTVYLKCCCNEIVWGRRVGHQYC